MAVHFKTRNCATTRRASAMHIHHGSAFLKYYRIGTQWTFFESDYTAFVYSNFLLTDRIWRYVILFETRDSQWASLNRTRYAICYKLICSFSLGVWIHVTITKFIIHHLWLLPVRSFFSWESGHFFQLQFFLNFFDLRYLCPSQYVFRFRQGI